MAALISDAIAVDLMLPPCVGAMQVPRQHRLRVNQAGSTCICRMPGQQRRALLLLLWWGGGCPSFSQAQPVTQPRLWDDDAPVADFLSHLGMVSYLDAFHQNGLDEMRYLKRMKPTLFTSLLAAQDIPQDDLERIVDAVAQLRQCTPQDGAAEQRRVQEQLMRRGQLSYGRIYINNSLSSMEYMQGHFGAAVPLHSLPLVFAEPPHACRLSQNNVTGKLVVAIRGRCSFLDKAGNLSAANASAVLIVNTRDEDLFRVSGGYALGDNPENVTLPCNITVAMCKTSGLPVLKQAMAEAAASVNGRAEGQVTVRMVPLECGAGRATCDPVTTADREFVKSVSIDSGYLLLPSGERFEFVASTFGGVLPVDQSLRLWTADPLHACGMIPSNSLQWAYYLSVGAVRDAIKGYGWARGGRGAKGTAAMVERGTCQLGEKVMNVQQTGAAVVIVLSERGVPIEPFAASLAHAPKLSTPAVMVTHEAGVRIREALSEGKGMMEVVLTAARPGFAERWMEVAHEPWPQMTEGEQGIRAALDERLRRHEGSEERMRLIKQSYDKEVNRMRTAAEEMRGVDGL